eukprot:SAG22_NODE_4834_length_1155_cov_1.185606_1_plen_83_part_10
MPMAHVPCLDVLRKAPIFYCVSMHVFHVCLWLSVFSEQQPCDHAANARALRCRGEQASSELLHQHCGGLSRLLPVLGACPALA